MTAPMLAGGLVGAAVFLVTIVIAEWFGGGQ